MSLIWGIPYLFIKIAVTEVSPAVVVGGRTIIGALVLVPIAARAGALRPALKAWPYVAAFGLVEMAIPWLLLGRAEQRVTSGFAGLLLATVPIFATLVARVMGDRNGLTPVRILGLGTGVVGVAALVGIESLTGSIDALSVVELLIVAICAYVDARAVHGCHRAFLDTCWNLLHTHHIDRAEQWSALSEGHRLDTRSGAGLHCGCLRAVLRAHLGGRCGESDGHHLRQSWCRRPARDCRPR